MSRSPPLPRDQGHPDDPADLVWGLWTSHGSHTAPRRHRLAELHQRGPVIEHGTLFTDQPFSEAALASDDQQILRRINAQPEPVTQSDYPDDEHDPGDEFGGDLDGDLGEAVFYEESADDLYCVSMGAGASGVSYRRWL